jgi:PAS domain S-box-containing protein
MSDHSKYRAPDSTSQATPPRFDLDAAHKQQAPGGIAHEAGELHRLLVESVQDYAIFALDAQGYILSWNAGAQRFKGYTAEEIVGKHFSIFYPQERIAEGYPEYELREAARVGRFEDEGWRLRKDGTRFWANVVITALRDSSGELVGYAKVTRDLSERREAEEALRLSEERFRLLVQGVKDYAIFLLDPQGHIATWNAGAQRIKGYTSEEIIGKHFSIFYPPERVAERFPQYELKVATEVGQYEDEGWRVRKDGTRFWANVLITALRNKRGELVGFGKVTRDLTERRMAEERALEDARRVAAEEAARREADIARDRSDRLQELTASLSAAYTVPEIANVVIEMAFPNMRVDAGAVALLEPPGQYAIVVGECGYGELPEWARRFSVNQDYPIGAVLRRGEPLVFPSRGERDSRFPATAKVLAPFEVSVVLPLKSRGGNIGAIAMHRTAAGDLPLDDLSFMESFALQVAQALERARLYEAEQQTRREAQESRARADEARVRADEANRAKSEFLAAMSHELRTPLNAIGGYAELLEMGISGPITGEQHEQLERIRRSQQHLLGIINDLLNFSRIEAGQVEYHFAEVPIVDVVEAVGHMIAPQAHARGLRFEGICALQGAVVWTDRGKVEQILLNLLSNAVKFTPAGGEVVLVCDRATGDYVELTVRDTGIGIAPDQLERVFEPFIQVGRSLTSMSEGTGLGLAISRDLARALGGDIRVESALGKGSAFTLVLPQRANHSAT